jgi:hypothetical protein
MPAFEEEETSDVTWTTSRCQAARQRVAACYFLRGREFVARSVGAARVFYVAAPLEQKPGSVRARKSAVRPSLIEIAAEFLFFLCDSRAPLHLENSQIFKKWQMLMRKCQLIKARCTGGAAVIVHCSSFKCFVAYD